MPIRMYIQKYSELGFEADIFVIVNTVPGLLFNKNVIADTLNANNNVIGVVFLISSAYNKSVIKKH